MKKSTFGLCAIAITCGSLATSQQTALDLEAPLTERICATPEPGAEVTLQSTEAARGFSALSAYFRVERVRFRVPVAFHVIHDNGRGDVTDHQIDLQLSVLNDKLGPEGFQFVRHSITRTNNPAWRVMVWNEASEMAPKTKLSVDSGRVLNFYIAVPASREFPPGSGTEGRIVTALGLATFPWEMDVPGRDNRRDGVIVHFKTLPGGPPGLFNLGYTGLHEVGHWIGLLHTFQGGGVSNPQADGCREPGDEVADTPYEHHKYEGPGPNQACALPEARNSCPDAGPDPIRNYMDYADDRCMSEWTPGQSYRTRNQMQRYRAAFVEASPDVQRFNRDVERLNRLLEGR
jgi:hypothetical protein